MVSRYLFALFAITLISVASINAAPAEEVDVDVDDLNLGEVERGFGSFFEEAAEEAGKALIKKVFDYLVNEVEKVNWECVPEVAKSCDEINPLYHPENYYECAKNYIVENKEHCFHSEEEVESPPEIE